jgi:cytochrome c556
MTLVEATNLLLIEGRQIAPPGSKSEAKDELEPADIQKLIAANRPAFIAQAHALHDVASIALAAIDAKDSKALLSAGGNIDATCEACHLQFWYPNQKIPRPPM